MVSLREEERYLRSAGYLLGERFSSGAFSTIHLAMRISDGEKVAVKVIDLRTTTREYRKRFLPREISNVATLHHPNIIRVERVGRSETKAYIVMAYARSNLRQQIEKCSHIEEGRARKWFQQLTSALDYLHRRGVVHRDLKIENILIDDDQNIKLCDFGFSKLCSVNGKQSLNSNTFCGSLGYCAPEILQRMPYNPRKTDIWSLGVVLFKMVIGGMPFGEGNDLGSVRKIARAQTQLLEFPSFPKISNNCQCLIRSLLAFESDHRITLMDIFRSEWVSADELKPSPESLANCQPAVPVQNHMSFQGTSTRTYSPGDRLVSANVRESSISIKSDRVKSSARPTSVISRIRMRLPTLSSKHFRRERL